VSTGWHADNHATVSDFLSQNGVAKHIVVLLDRTWEPTLAPAVDAVQEIRQYTSNPPVACDCSTSSDRLLVVAVHDVCQPIDQLGVATTGGEWLVALSVFGEAREETQLTATVQAACDLGVISEAILLLLVISRPSLR